MLSMYPACFYKEDDGYSVIFPDLNYLTTKGDSFEDAMAIAVECLAAHLHSCKTDGEAVPVASSLTDIDPVAISKEISPDDSIGEAFVNIVSVDVEAYAKADSRVKKDATSLSRLSLITILKQI